MIWTLVPSSNSTMLDFDLLVPEITSDEYVGSKFVENVKLFGCDLTSNLDRRVYSSGDINVGLLDSLLRMADLIGLIRNIFFPGKTSSQLKLQPDPVPRVTNYRRFDGQVNPNLP